MSPSHGLVFLLLCFMAPCRVLATADEDMTENSDSASLYRKSWEPTSGLFGMLKTVPKPTPTEIKRKSILLFGPSPPRNRLLVTKVNPPTDLTMRLLKLRDNARLICLASWEQSPLCRTLKEVADPPQSSSTTPSPLSTA